MEVRLAPFLWKRKRPFLGYCLEDTQGVETTSQGKLAGLANRVYDLTSRRGTHRPDGQTQSLLWVSQYRVSARHGATHVIRLRIYC